MKRSWSKFLSQILSVLEELRDEGVPDPYFRGHAESNWALLPSLGRRKCNPSVEARLYYGFTSLGGHLIPVGASTWDVLFLMQHHGLPTRLLDWTENFSVALYFAMQGVASEGAIWILNPYELNHQVLGEEQVKYLNSEYPKGYEHYFIPEINETFPANILAIGSDSRAARVRSQRGVFTLHRDLSPPLNVLHPMTVRKIVLPKDALAEAKEFLRLAGVNNFSIFPDLDGLAKYLISEELG